MSVYLTADLHFGHKLATTSRGFKTIEEHDNIIISNWNKVISKRDLVFVLGDVAIKREHIQKVGLLNGRKILIGGNHDVREHYVELTKYFEKILGALKYKGYMLTHIPIHPKELYDNDYRNPYRGNIHGHVHSKSLDDKAYYNVCVDVHNYTPIEFNELIK